MELKKINQFLSVLGLVLVLEIDTEGKIPTKLYIMSSKKYRKRTLSN